MIVKAEYDGRSIRPLDPQAIADFKRDLKTGDQLTMQIERAEKTRSRLQQGLFHKILGRYARAMGESSESVKIRWKVDLGYWLPAAKLLSGELDLPSWRGAWIDLHDVYPMLHAERTIAFVRSEADYTKKMSSELSEYAIQHCQENDVDIDDILRELETSK